MPMMAQGRSGASCCPPALSPGFQVRIDPEALKLHLHNLPSICSVPIFVLWTLIASLPVNADMVFPPDHESVGLLLHSTQFLRGYVEYIAILQILLYGQPWYKQVCWSVTQSFIGNDIQGLPIICAVWAISAQSSSHSSSADAKLPMPKA